MRVRSTRLTISKRLSTPGGVRVHDEYAIAELALNDAKHMLDSRAHLAEPVIAGMLAGRQPAAGFGLLLHRPESYGGIWVTTFG